MRHTSGSITLGTGSQIFGKNVSKTFFTHFPQNVIYHSKFLDDRFLVIDFQCFK